MLKNKYAKYILAPILIAVWGTVFYQVYQAMKGDSYEVPTPPPFIAMVEDSNQVEDNYSLLLDYRDPFFGKRVKATSYRAPRTNMGNSYTPSSTNQGARSNTPRPANPKSKNTTKKGQEPKPTPPPIIRYQGMTASAQDTVALVKIGDRFYPNMRVGNRYQGVRLLKVFADSVRMSWQGEILVIGKE